MVWKPSRATLMYSVIGTCIGGVFIIKSTVGGKRPEFEFDKVDKVVIVTGANSGIGKETVREFAKRSSRVIMACRDMEKCEKAREEIVLETGNKYLYCRPCDLASHKSIRKFVETYKKEHDRLDILINNAGVMLTPYSLTDDGIEMQLGVNHMGPFLLTNLLLDILKASAPSRIINVTSIAYKRGEINTDDLNSEKAYDKKKAYEQSKLAIILFSKELASRLQGTRVTVNTVYPGISRTDITRHMGFENSTFTMIFGKPFLSLFMKTANQGAQTTLYAALEPSLENVSGKFFADCHEDQLFLRSKDASLARWLWAVSEKWTGLKS